jgi:hypothetical protein
VTETTPNPSTESTADPRSATDATIEVGATGHSDHTEPAPPPGPPPADAVHDSGAAHIDESRVIDPADFPQPVTAAGPSGPAGLRVSDTDRETVAQALRDAGREGRLTPDELATRESAAYAAVTAPELFALVNDLPVARELAASQLAPYGLRPEPILSGTGSARPVTMPAGTTPTTLWSVLGEVKRTGKWDVPERLSVHLALGETRLDLREATLTAPVTTIDILGTLGEVKVIVPDSWRIECSGSGVLGSYQVKDVDAAVPPAPDAPLLRFSGAMLLGEVTIYRTHAAAGTGAFSIDGLAGVRNRRRQAWERRRRHVSGWHGSS